MIDYTYMRQTTARAKYLFLFIGDGMGPVQRYAAAELARAAGAPAPGLLMDSFPAQGFATTYDLNSDVPDSASTATALATGHKTFPGVIAMDAEGRTPYRTITETAKEAGWRVGVVSSVSIDHATPACFYAHLPARASYREIAEALVQSDYDYFAGGPVKFPVTDDRMEEERPNIYTLAQEHGYALARTRAELDALQPGRKAFVTPTEGLTGDALSYRIDGTPAAALTLADFTRRGIELLDNPQGFFMMVEGGRIDWACHANDAAAALHEVRAFDEAIAEAYRFSTHHPDETLIIVTADHETGGMTLRSNGLLARRAMHLLWQQRVSHVKFRRHVARWREDGGVYFEDVAPAIAEHFGLLLSNGDGEAGSGLRLTGEEEALLRQSFADSMLGHEERASDPYIYALYGGYEPFVVRLTATLAHRAGIAWASHSHTGTPVPVAALGPGCERFNGYYDNTDIYHGMMELAGLTQRAFSCPMPVRPSPVLCAPQPALTLR